MGTRTTLQELLQADHMILFRTRGLPPDERIDATHDRARSRDPVDIVR